VVVVVVVVVVVGGCVEGALLQHAAGTGPHGQAARVPHAHRRYHHPTFFSLCVCFFLLGIPSWSSSWVVDVVVCCGGAFSPRNPHARTVVVVVGGLQGTRPWRRGFTATWPGWAWWWPGRHQSGKAAAQRACCGRLR
jgi:hypothetical protein